MKWKQFGSNNSWQIEDSIRGFLANVYEYRGMWFTSVPCFEWVAHPLKAKDAATAKVEAFAKIRGRVEEINAALLNLEA